MAAEGGPPGEAGANLTDDHGPAIAHVKHLVVRSKKIACSKALDGHASHGNFNNMRRFMRKLGERRIGGECIEDKLFPEANSFISEAQDASDRDGDRDRDPRRSKKAVFKA